MNHDTRSLTVGEAQGMARVDCFRLGYYLLNNWIAAL